MARTNNPSPAVQKHVDKVVKEFIAGLKKGKIPWVKPWDNAIAVPYNGATGKTYRGINLLTLGFSTTGSSEWWTEKQAIKAGGTLMRKSGAARVVFQAPIAHGEVVEDGEEVGDEDRVGFMSALFTVYPRDNFDGLPPPKKPIVVSIADRNGHKRSPHVEDAIRATKANVREFASNTAFFSWSEDVVVIPKIEQFRSANDYYATLWHELTHWSGGKTRLNRQFGTKFGDPTYAFEELVAELGAVFCCGALGIQTDNLQHQAYINAWISKLQSQPTYLMRAAAHASQAMEYLLPDLHKPIKAPKVNK